MNTFGRIFKVSIFGESHGVQVGIVIDGCPAGIALSEDDLAGDLARRKSGAKGTTPRKEADKPEIVSGLFNGYTTGAPMTILFRNENTLSGDYKNLVTQPRPGHADWVAGQKFNGYQDYRGGGHFSGRITLGVVAAGVVAKKIIAGTDIKAQILEIGGCTDPEQHPDLIEKTLRSQDSLGGIVECRVDNVPVGWGEPFFDSAESVISHAAFSIPAVKAIEFGAGFNTARMKGSENNDPIVDTDGKTATNHAGGINGGITNGNPIVFRVAVKPTSSISQKQRTLQVENGQMEDLVVKGRHDACIALRVPVVLEAVTAIALADLALVHKARTS